MRSKQYARRLLVLFIVLVLLIVLFKVPLATITTKAPNYVYINHAFSGTQRVHTSIGRKVVASASPLHAVQTKTLFVLPFITYSVNASPATMSAADILNQAGVKLNGYVASSPQFYFNSRWLTVVVGSPVPDGGAYTAVLSWQPASGTWHHYGNYDGSWTGDQQDGLPATIIQDLGIQRD